MFCVTCLVLFYFFPTDEFVGVADGESWGWVVEEVAVVGMVGIDESRDDVTTADPFPSTSIVGNL